MRDTARGLGSRGVHGADSALRRKRPEHLEVLGPALDRLERGHHGSVRHVAAHLDVEHVVPALAADGARLELLQVHAALGKVAQHVEERARRVVHAEQEAGRVVARAHGGTGPGNAEAEAHVGHVADVRAHRPELDVTSAGRRSDGRAAMIVRRRNPRRPPATVRR